MVGSKAMLNSTLGTSGDTLNAEGIAGSTTRPGLALNKPKGPVSESIREQNNADITLCSQS